jgi:hypothetical protein
MASVNEKIQLMTDLYQKLASPKKDLPAARKRIANGRPRRNLAVCHQIAKVGNPPRADLRIEPEQGWVWGQTQLFDRVRVQHTTRWRQSFFVFPVPMFPRIARGFRRPA